MRGIWSNHLCRQPSSAGSPLPAGRGRGIASPSCIGDDRRDDPRSQEVTDEQNRWPKRLHPRTAIQASAGRGTRGRTRKKLPQGAFRPTQREGGSPVSAPARLRLGTIVPARWAGSP